MSGPRLTLHIDRLVLRGIDPTDRQAFASGMKCELARVLADPQLRAAITKSRRTPVMRLGKLQMEPGQAGARKLGTGVARAIGREMKQ
jgi:hypothetical protein